ncbi:MAG: hypothetical protein LKJ45_05805 [Oscillospiraceae bacterium]|jgi:hypothetical protein|nr:hypothetical protein [Oscillospiraceae bacterium]
MMKLPLNQQNFVTDWLISGPVCSAYTPPADLPKVWTDQLGYEKTLREVFDSGIEDPPPQNIRLGGLSGNGKPWRYYYSPQNWFVDVSAFYTQPAAIRLDAAAVLNSETAQTVSAVLWTYAAVDLWVNGKQVLQAQKPVYKPIRKYSVQLPLRKGGNTVYARMHSLGIRDTRSLFGLQLEQSAGVSADLPDRENAAPCVRFGQWLSSLVCRKGILTAYGDPPCSAVVKSGGHELFPIEKAGNWTIPSDISSFSVSGTLAGTSFSRSFELMEHLHPNQSAGDSQNYRRDFLKHIAAQKWEPRDSNTHFGVFHVMARLLLHRERPGDEELLLQDLQYIDRCEDCADFLVVGFIRLLHQFDVSEPVKQCAKKSLLSFRYWMDEPGNDGMCYWSENHALMFYGSQLAVGQMFPDDVFRRSGRTGRQQSRIGAERCRSWLNDVERDGAEEFNSASYLPVTVTALLNLVDFAPDDISRRAWSVLDSLMRQLFRHVFQKSVVSPQGRVYRDVIYPYRQSVQSLLHMVSPEFPYSDAENIWDVNLFTSRYRFPDDLLEIAGRDACTSYVSGNARIVLKKTADYILTSVRSPRGAADSPGWHNLCFDPNADRNSNAYVKSLNERFHGTSVFEPGVYGYQQHLWYAALSSECVVFVNHPGSTVDCGEMRPGYWFGNGVFPALLQKGNALGAVYEIPGTHPICFTHVFWPAVKFDETVQGGHWLFGRREKGCVGLWCSGDLQPADNVLGECEYRSYGRKTAYYCICGSLREIRFPDFMARCKAARPVYDPQAHMLRAEDGFSLPFVPCRNETQYI